MGFLESFLNPGGKPYWEKWEDGEFYLEKTILPGTLQGYEFGRNQLADGRTAGDETYEGPPSSGPDLKQVGILATVLFLAYYANDQGFLESFLNPGGKPYWEKWEDGEFYLEKTILPGTLQGYEFGRNQLADGCTGTRP